MVTDTLNKVAQRRRVVRVRRQPRAKVTNVPMDVLARHVVPHLGRADVGAMGLSGRHMLGAATDARAAITRDKAARAIAQAHSPFRAPLAEAFKLVVRHDAAARTGRPDPELPAGWSRRHGTNPIKTWDVRGFPAGFHDAAMFSASVQPASFPDLLDAGNRAFMMAGLTVFCGADSARVVTVWFYRNRVTFEDTFSGSVVAAGMAADTRRRVRVLIATLLRDVRRMAHAPVEIV